MEDTFGHVRLRGEISGYRGPHSSGHCYFALKDEKAKIDAIIWRGVFQKLAVRPEEGLEVIATGKVTTYAGRSTYQIIIEHLEPAGEGALLALLKERERKFSAEGLFDKERKQLLPVLPRTIGVVTSPTGAVIRDILHRIADRFPVHIIVWPVRVQGEGSGAEVAGAIAGFNALDPAGPVRRPDLLIVARGGGSLEDLWGFNDEDVVRAAAASQIPLISAVGHETDWTLIDHAADLRAPTPTAAAELAVPVRRDLDLRIGETAMRGRRGIQRIFAERRARTDAAAGRLPRRAELFSGPRQRLDLAAGGLGQGLSAAMFRRRDRLTRATGRLTPHALIGAVATRRARVEGHAARARGILDQRLTRADGRLAGLAARLTPGALMQRGRADRRRIAELEKRAGAALRRAISERRRAVRSSAQLLASLGHRNVLARGYALVRGADAGLIRSAENAREAGDVIISFADGDVGARVGTASDPAPPRPKPQPRPAGKAPKSGGQGSLF